MKNHRVKDSSGSAGGAGSFRYTSDHPIGRQHIRTFGGLTISGCQLQTSPILSAKQRELLRWLVLAPWGPPLEVTTVCDCMWPGSDGAAAISNFSSTVRRLRQALGAASSVIVSAGTVRLEANLYSIDLDFLREINESTFQPQSSNSAKDLAMKMLSTFGGANPVLEAKPSGLEMARRIQAVETAWRHATLRLLGQLQDPLHVPLALLLCERIERHGLADERVVAHWSRLSDPFGP